MKEKTKTIFAWMGCGFTVLLILVMVLIGFFFLSLRSSWGQDFEREKFNQAIWLSMTGSEDSRNPRGPMTKDLIKNHLKAGTERAEIVELLGEPDYDVFGEASDISPPHVMRYYLGFWSGMHMDPDSLDVYFDERDRFVEAHIVQH